MSRHGRPNCAPPGLQSKSAPNLPTLHSLQSPSRAANHGEDNSGGEEEGEEAAAAAAAVGEEEEEEEEEEEDDDDDDQDEQETLHTSRSSTHLPRDSAFFPPFYGRPPTPLPPSPSLTSLLRPSSFSAATSRPTTPESSDVDRPGAASTPTANLHHMTASARHAPTVPRASPKVPTYEYYGFAVYLGSSAAFLMYILWAYVPAPLLHHMGIHYYPNRWWALAVPCWLVVLVCYIYVALASYNTKYLTLPLESCENLVDATAQIAVVDKKTGGIVGKPSVEQGEGLDAYRFHADDEVEWKALWNTGTDAVMDVPIGAVCEILYAGEE